MRCSGIGRARACKANAQKTCYANPSRNCDLHDSEMTMSKQRRQTMRGKTWPALQPTTSGHSCESRGKCATTKARLRNFEAKYNKEVTHLFVPCLDVRLSCSASRSDSRIVWTNGVLLSCRVSSRIHVHTHWCSMRTCLLNVVMGTVQANSRNTSNAMLFCTRTRGGGGDDMLKCCSSVGRHRIDLWTSTPSLL